MTIKQDRISVLGKYLVAFFIFTLPVSAQTCTGQRDDRSQPKIVGGWPALIEHWPGQAVFRLYDENNKEAQYFCGGTAITPNWILTAAHCFDSIGADSQGRYTGPFGQIPQVRLGSDNLKEGDASQMRAIDTIILHEHYKRGKAEENGYDIALVKIASPWHGPLSTLSLTHRTDPANESKRVMVAGFGLTKGMPGGGKLRKYQRSGGEFFFAGSDTLLQTAIPTVTTRQCARRYPRDKIENGQICAGVEEGSKDSCNGDSGGPLVVYTKDGCPYQVGLVSWGPQDCGAAKYYGVYTRVSHFANWIAKHVPDVKGIRPFDKNEKAETVAANRENARFALKQIETLFKDGKGKVQLRIRLVKGGMLAENKVQVDQRYAFDISSEVAGHLILVDIDEDGKVTQIFPNKYTKTIKVSALASGKTIQVPNKSYGFDWFRADIPAEKTEQASVKGKLIALIVPQGFPLEAMVAADEQLSKAFVPEKASTSYLMNLINQIASFWRKRGLSPNQHEHAYAIMDYEIINR